jgi:hypothetical protein
MGYQTAKTDKSVASHGELDPERLIKIVGGPIAKLSFKPKFGSWKCVHGVIY